MHVQWPSVWDFGSPGSWPGCQASKIPDLGSHSDSSTRTEFLHGKRKCTCEAPEISEHVQQRRKRHLQGEKQKFAGRDKTTLKLETGNSHMDAPPLQASVYYTNPKWEREALEKTKYCKAYESTGTTYKKRWVKSAAISPKEVWVIDKSASLPQHPACPNPYLSLMHAYVRILSIMVRIGKTCQTTYVMDLFERAAEGKMLGSGTQCNPERGKHTETWMTLHTSHRQVRLLQGTGWPLTFKLWPL